MSEEDEIAIALSQIARSNQNIAESIEKIEIRSDFDRRLTRVEDLVAFIKEDIGQIKVGINVVTEKLSDYRERSNNEVSKAQNTWPATPKILLPTLVTIIAILLGVLSNWAIKFIH